MRLVVPCCLVLLALSVGCGADDDGSEPVAEPAPAAVSVLEGQLPLLDGTAVDLAGFRGSAVLVVNTASHCGYTPQYDGLEALYERYRDEGLVVLGFPANDFGGQEPGSDEEIATVCRLNYGVTFPVFSKVTVLGPDAPALYRGLAAAPEPVGEPPTWNFTKYLLDREGRPVARFDPSVEPDDPGLVAAVEDVLAGA